MKKSNENVELFNATKFLTKYIVTQGIILYLVVLIGNFLLIMFDNHLIGRYIPIAIITVISTFLVIMLYAKKSSKSEEKGIKRNCFIVPIILAVIMLLYGLYSVSSNIADARREMESSLRVQTLIFGEEAVEEIMNVAIEEARKEANTMWIITSIVYLVVAEGVTVVATKKLSNWLKEEIQVNDLDAIYSGDFQSSETLNLNNTNTESTDSIKWNL